jgi:predicted phage terminase large subunit-like protein
LNCREAFYGGAVGGGKSDALLMAALQYVDVPKYSAIIFRNTYTDLALPGALMERAEEWLGGTEARWHDTIKTWEFPIRRKGNIFENPAKLCFGYLNYPRDHLLYRSSEFQYAGFDEASILRWKQMMYIHTTRMRKLEGSPIPIRTRMASNPGGISHLQIKKRYIDLKTRKKGVVFIPAKLEDNPYLNTKEYRESLSDKENLDAVTRQQLLHGDWEIREAGRVFDSAWYKLTDTPPAPIEIDKVVRFWDMASTEPKKENKDPDWTAGCKMALTKQKLCYVLDLVRFREKPDYCEFKVKNIADRDGIDVKVRMEQEPGSSGVHSISTYSKILKGYDFGGVLSTGNKMSRANPVASYASKGYMHLLNGHYVEDFLDEHDLFPDGEHDDQIDAESGAFQYLCNPRKVTKSRGRMRIV